MASALATAVKMDVVASSSHQAPTGSPPGAGLQWPPLAQWTRVWVSRAHVTDSTLPDPTPTASRGVPRAALSERPDCVTVRATREQRPAGPFAQVWMAARARRVCLKCKNASSEDTTKNVDAQKARTSLPSNGNVLDMISVC